MEIPPEEFFADTSDGGGAPTPPPPPPPTSDVTPPQVPRIVKWFIKGAILTIIFSGDDDSNIDIVSDVAGVVATFTGSSAEQTAEIELGPDAEEFTVVATDPAGNKSVSDPVYVEEETEPTDPSVDSDPGVGTQRADRSEDDGSGPNLLLIGGLVAGAAAVGGGVEYARRRRAHRRVAAFDHDEQWAGSRKGGGPLDPPGDF